MHCLICVSKPWQILTESQGVQAVFTFWMLKLFFRGSKLHHNDEWPSHDPLFSLWDKVNLAQFSPAASFLRKAKWLSKSALEDLRKTFKHIWVPELLIPKGGRVSGYVNLRGLWPHLWVIGHLSTFWTLLPMFETCCTDTGWFWFLLHSGPREFWGFHSLIPNKSRIP